MIPSHYSRRSERLRKGVLVATAISAMGMMASDIAWAQDAAEEIVVTGSRIVRRDYESNSPITTVDSADFETQTGLNIESYLNQLPEYNPAASPVTTQGDVQITPVNSVGIASISLRGFGANRSLVLVDGHRPTPINALMVTDINGIPSALIERVETITGGASAVYGADAIGGVTNFILRDDFEGFEVDTQYGVQDAGDGTEYRISAILGANFADGRGNVTMGLEQYSREEALQVNRDIYRDYWTDPQTGGSFFFIQGTNAYSCNAIQGCPSFAATKSLFDGQNPSAWFAGFTPDNGQTPTYVDFQFNSDGTIWASGFPFRTPTGQANFNGTIDGLQYSYQTVLDSSDPTGEATFSAIKWNNTKAYASAPQDRWSFFTSGNFDLSDTVTAFGRATFAESETRTLLFGTNAISGWETSLPYDPSVDSPIDPSLDYTDVNLLIDVVNNPGNYANPNFVPTGTAGAHFPVPYQLALLLNSRPDPTARWQPQWNPDTSLPPRNTFNTNSVWQIEAGLDIELPIKDWTAEVYYSHGQSSTYNVAGGNLSLSRYRALANYPDYGRGASGTGNQLYLAGTGADQVVTNAIRPAFGVGDFNCTSGFYDTYFGGDQPLSEDCFNAINATLQTRTQNQQDIIELNFQGSLINLPAGEARFAAGFQARDNEAQFNPDILQSQDSFMDQVVGVYPTGYLDASTSVKDYYVEALVPVLSDITGVDMLELELGARYSDYNETDAETTWKVLANWQVNDWVRMRGGFNRATRAPNLGELFLNPQEIFTGGGSFGDACSVRANAPYGAGGTQYATDPVQNPATEPDPTLAPGQTQAGADSTYLICEALMGGPGSLGATTFYDSGLDVTQQGGGGGFAWVLQQGNPELQSETADTWTFGGVVRSPSDNPWLAGLNATIDYYDVEITDAIMLYSLDYAAYRCFGTNTVSTPAEAAAQAATLGCSLIPRDQNNGNALNTLLSYDNQATIQTSGMDVGVNWFAELGSLGFDVPGSLGLSMNATILNEYKTKQSPASYDVEVDWKGSLGPNLSGTNGGAYDYRLFGNISYMMDNWSVMLRWRHLPGVYTAGYAQQQGIIENNARVTAGGDGLVLGYTPSTEIETDSYNIFDLSFNYNVNDNLTLRGGITNLFDEEPPNVGSNAGRPPGSSLDVCNSAPGCSNPTSFSLPSKGGYSGGYYDTLGRRFFIGLKASF